MAEEPAAAEAVESRSAGQTTTITLPQAAPEIGFSQPVTIGFGVGILLLLLTGLFRALVVTSDEPAEGLADTSVWFGWLGSSTIALALVAAGFTARTASVGVRAALLLVGTYLFIQATDTYGGLLSALSQFF